MTNAQKEISLAASHDAAGEHDEAINALARATKLGDVNAMTQLGKRLVAGDRAPLLPKEGVQMLMDAAQEGDSEAPARLATLAAAGIYMQQSMKSAVTLLVEAAQRGWPPAQEQLLALSFDPAVQQIAAATQPPHFWQHVGDTLDLAYWVEAPPAVTLHEAPLIRSFDDLLPASICNWLISRSAGRLQRALVYDAIGSKEFANRMRTNKIAQFNLMNTDLAHLLAQMRMSAACQIPLYNMEATAILHYDPGEEITNHFDFVNPNIPNYADEIANNGQRVLTFLVYLNEDYDDGETNFPRLGIRHKGRRGQGLFFVNATQDGQPDLRSEHAGCPPSNGEKWIVSQFVRNRRLLGAIHN